MLADSAGRQPSRGSIGAVFGSRIKCDDDSRSGFMDCVNNRFKDCKALRRQADARADYNAGIVCRSQVTLYRLPSRSIRTNVSDIALPSPVRHLLECKHNPARILADQQNTRHDRYLLSIPLT